MTTEDPCPIPQGDSVRVFVAATPAEWLPCRVLEFSIKETSALNTRVQAIYNFKRSIPMPLATENRPRTPFSFQRFLIPELCGFSGKAIYLDADMQVFQDIGHLWSQDFAGCNLQTVQEAKKGRRGQFSVMLLDCKALNWNIEQIIADLDAGRLDYAGLMYEMRVAGKIGRDIPSDWNSLERFEAGKTALLHYTDMNTQPWVSTENPLGDLWIACLRRAMQAGFVTRDDLIREIAAGHVRPSLLAQIDVEVDDSIALPGSIRGLDHGFVAPFRSIRSGKSSPWTSITSAALSFLRRGYYRSPLPRYLKRD